MFRYLRSLSTTQILILIFLFSFFLFMYNNSYTAVWFDESFTIRLSQHSFFNIINITSQDVHPPLFYFMLKVYCSIFGYNMFAIRLFSLLPILLLIMCTSTVYRKEFGYKTAIIFILLIILMPVMLYVTSEVRMYSWCMFWVFLSGLFAYRLSKDSFRTLNCFIYVFSSIVAAYTHYYGLICISLVYVFLFVYIFIYNKKKILFVSGLGFAIAVLFFPWLMILINQITSVKEQFWIPPVAFSDIIGHIYYPYDIRYPQMDVPNWFTSITSKLFFLFFLLSVFIFIKSQFTQNKRKIVVANMALGLYILPVVIGVFLSIVFKPVIVSRYLICGLSFLFVAYSIYFSSLDYSKLINKLITGLYFSILIFFFVSNFYWAQKWAKERDHIQSTFVKYIENNLNDETAFIYSERNAFGMGVYTFLFPDAKHYALIDSASREYSFHKSVLNNIKNYSPISNYGDIDVKYTRIFSPENFEKKNNLIYKEKDSIEIVKLFEIKNKINAGLQNYTLYQLERRKVSE